MSSGIKIAVIGPKGSGKTRFSNFVAKQAFPENLPYSPTVGVRILQFVYETKSSQPVEVELWDCSGDQAYEACWPAILKDLSGIVVVHDASSQAQISNSKLWFEWFATKAGLSLGQCMMVGITENTSTSLEPMTLAIPDPVQVVPKALSLAFGSGENNSHSPAAALATSAFSAYLTGLRKTLGR